MALRDLRWTPLGALTSPRVMARLESQLLSPHQASKNSNSGHSRRPLQLLQSKQSAYLAAGGVDSGVLAGSSRRLMLATTPPHWLWQRRAQQTAQVLPLPTAKSPFPLRLRPSLAQQASCSGVSMPLARARSKSSA